jgi:hypothetical protein
MNDKRPKISVEDRLQELRDNGIKVITCRGNLDETLSKFSMSIGTCFYFNLVENQIIGRFSDGSAEFISEEKITDKSSNLEGTIAYAKKLGFDKEDETWLKLEAHAIYEPLLEVTHFFVLPSRSYLLQKQTEQKPQYQ